MRLLLLLSLSLTCCGRTGLDYDVIGSGDAAAALDGMADGDARRDGDIDAADAGPWVAQISAGSLYTCALVSTGVVRCWGPGGDGAIGDGTNYDRYIPTDVVSLGGPATWIAVGLAHACAVVSSGEVRCWGDNPFGQLGNGMTKGSLVPVVVAGLGGSATSVGTGDHHTCALLSSGSVRCWGRNNFGQLGNGTTTDSLVPVDVALGGSASAVVVGGSTSCALLSSGGVRCWGYNQAGQLGDGTNIDRSSPVDVLSLGGTVASLSGAQGAAICVLLSSGTMRCWGDNTRGNLGDGTDNSRSLPVDVVGLGGQATSISAGTTTCAVLSSGALRCWGGNSYGETGDGTTNNRWDPGTVMGLTATATAVSTGSDQTCAILSDGTVQCWGEAPLGDGTNTDSRAPVTVLNLP